MGRKKVAQIQSKGLFDLIRIKPASPQLNGKVERSHRSDQEEFYQLLTYKDDVDLKAKLGEWEHFHISPDLMEPSKAKRLTKY